MFLFHFIGNLEKSGDLKTAVDKFIEKFENENDVKIISFLAEDNVVKPGYNLLSGIVRLNFDYKKGKNTESGKVIIKVPSLTRLPYEILKSTSLFKREVYVYSTFLPKLYQLGNCKAFAPELYLATEDTVLVLEDLTVEGFEPGDRIKQFNLNECKAALNVLATYHALSYEYLRSLTSSDRGWSFWNVHEPKILVQLRKETFNKFRELAKPHLNQVLYDKISQLEEEIITDPMKKEFPRQNPMTVIIHGDFRNDNILINHKGNLEVKLIDWQTSRKASPVLDLIFFFVTSVPLEEFKTHGDVLKNTYLDTLKKKLEPLNSIRTYGRSELDEDIKYYKSYFLHVICIFWLKLMVGSSPESAEVADLYISNAVKWLLYLDESGLLNG
ncbi:hypothetical protein V9T40_001280 [Parthenolecanium corni]|uniref:CHK kinase-like domain-containing protein n=1 Tax=Parthenolecanium corni TaxID=536013 RepID=A0AAN9TS16_9HEMI